ncbi:MAG: family 78 glycoside hydrolase catalytic domain [Actinomycetaceae bacterium]|nr:family 78 glycoside hydrolase catalytic domain [Actinomycetaceae bacterium]
MTTVPDPIGPLTAPTHLRVDAFVPGNVLGTGNPSPCLSWILPSAPKGWDQNAYDIEISPISPDRTVASGTEYRIESADSVLIPWPGTALSSRERVQVRVRVHGGDSDGAANLTSDWSEPLTIEAGLLEAADWQAVPVGPAWPENPESDRRPVRVRRDFEVAADVACARLYLSAHGLVRAHINGQRVGVDELVPGWTVYESRLEYRTYDVTDLVASGANAIGCELADGWFRGHIGFDGGYRNLWGEHVGAIAQLEITHSDGSRTVLATDDSWTAGAGPILFTGLYEGESYDARLEDAAWAKAGGGANWAQVRTHPSTAEVMVAPVDDPVRVTAEIAPVSMTRCEEPPSPFPMPDDPAAPPAPVRHILDFGQNFSGRLRIRVRGAAGEVIRLRHAEVLETNGELSTRPLRGAHATDTYILRGDPAGEEWEPAFTIHGFRYAEISAPESLSLDDVVARVIHTEMTPLGEFSCSDADVTRLHENALWSMRSNFVSIPSDCPQRDERLGWTGDIQAFAPTALFHHDCRGLLRGWLADLWVEQQKYGIVPWYVPVIPGGFWTPPRGAAVWGDAATFVPWEIYRATGDAEVLRDQWDSAKAWVDYVDSRAGTNHLWEGDLQLGDWLDPAAPPDNPMQALTDANLVATAFFARSAWIASQWALVLGFDGEAAHYGQLSEAIALAFRERWVGADHRMESHSQTAYALGIAFDLAASSEQRSAWGEFLSALVDDSDGHVATGFAGTPVLCEALSSTGHTDAAYTLLLTRTVPSWLYAVTMGATTTWERWDSLLPDGSVNPGDMTSFNHYALGAVDTWLVRSLAGLAPGEPGYRQIRIEPHPGGNLTWAKASHLSPYGVAQVEWRIEGGQLTVRATVPVGATAEVVLPGADPVVVGHGHHELSAPHLGDRV